MAFHPRSASLMDYLIAIVPDLLKAIETISISLWRPGDDQVDGVKILISNFRTLACELAVADGDISEMEMAFYADTANLLSGRVHIYFSPATMREELKRFVASMPTVYRNVSLPTILPYLTKYDEDYRTNHATVAKEMFFRFATDFVNSDGAANHQEKSALSTLAKLLYPPEFSHQFNPTSVTTVQRSMLLSMLPPAPQQDSETKTKTAKSHTANERSTNGAVKGLDSLYAELNSLVGLDNVKNDVIQQANFIKVQRLRQSKGLPTATISKHLVFSGNPGTGKTRVARLLAQIYQVLGVVSKGHLVETDRSGLVGGYLGQTALKVNEVVTRALGGVLFIDEAYSLTSEHPHDMYGVEAIDTLVKLMEDNRDDLIVIVPGYSERMEKFLRSNPGLKSRFNKYLHFQDYDDKQLTEIFERFCREAGYTLSLRARMHMLCIFYYQCGERDETFGNARLARNYFEQTINNQATRLASLPNITEDELVTIEVVDTPGYDGEVIIDMTQEPLTTKKQILSSRPVRRPHLVRRRLR